MKKINSILEKVVILGDLKMKSLPHTLVEDAISKSNSESIELAKMLIKYGYNPNYINRYNKTSLLMKAIYWENIELAELLLQKGADIDYIDNKKQTALFYAALETQFKICKLLVNYNANVSIIRP